jgi:hypothetical protein
VIQKRREVPERMRAHAEPNAANSASMMSTAC